MFIADSTEVQKMFKCTGVCSTCGRCHNSAMMSGANDRKTKILTYPDDFQPDDFGAGYGLAVDIGSTTVVGMLWDLKNGKHIASCAKANPQNEFGMDVISRITYCIENDGLPVLHDRIKSCIDMIIQELCRDAAICREDILKMTVCGNTTMSHLYLGKDPSGLAAAPFAPAYTGTVVDDNVTIIPNIAGHVGGDITAGIVASQLLNSKGLTLFIDIGTNGEIVLTDGTRVLACSTAAGPAFEGASIFQGMRASAGAIERVEIDKLGDVKFNVIGGCEPAGICGSGLIDAVAQMLKHGIINKKGRIISSDGVAIESMRDRLVAVDGHRSFILVAKENGDDIVITQNDIREIQLAKAAIVAGIKIMLEELNKTEDDIDKVIIAGAFGSYIDKTSAIQAGILPQISPDKVISAGNAAGAGVSMALMSQKAMDAMKALPDIVEHIDLARKNNFQKIYIKAMNF